MALGSPPPNPVSVEKLRWGKHRLLAGCSISDMGSCGGGSTELLPQPCGLAMAPSRKELPPRCLAWTHCTQQASGSLTRTGSPAPGPSTTCSRAAMAQPRFPPAPASPPPGRKALSSRWARLPRLLRLCSPRNSPKPHCGCLWGTLCRLLCRVGSQGLWTETACGQGRPFCSRG